jgi:hypothetical protein
MLVFNKYFYKKNKSKLYFGDRVAVLNDFIYQTGGSTSYLYGTYDYLLAIYLNTLLVTTHIMSRQNLLFLTIEIKQLVTFKF